VVWGRFDRQTDRHEVANGRSSLTSIRMEIAAIKSKIKRLTELELRGGDCRWKNEGIKKVSSKRRKRQ